MPRPASPRIVFAGTPDFAVPPLQRLIENGLKPLAVLTQPDRPAGRGRKLQASPVKHAALEAGIAVHQPASLRNEEFTDWLNQCRPDLMVVVAYGLILPAEVLAIPRHGCWNIHASLLPRWRGAAPIQRAIEAGDAVSGVCIMQMDEGLDTGGVLLRRETPIGPDDTGGSLHDRLAELGADALLQAVNQLAAGERPRAEPQPAEGVTYARKLDKAEARIDWREPAATLARRVRAFNPWPVAWCDIGGERTRIWDASARSDAAEAAEPGAVLNAGPDGIAVATGDGILVLRRLQRPGGRPVSAAEYLNARTPPDRLAVPA
ncbi:methionyl-tRNA formyltransferase [Elongatibacter sediminis]|uniref:Methionyl-tRNA formyltransferase n=1 Tax=Elongatibacter sediminis TaxID=3119006 RepID=A0AAW9RH82_9GAMM